MHRSRSLAVALVATAICSLSTPISHAASSLLTYQLHWEANHTVALLSTSGATMKTLTRGHQITIRHGSDLLIVSLKSSTVSRPVPAMAEQVLGAINASRYVHKVPLLTLSAQQSVCSTSHSTHMAHMGAISHDQFPTDVCIPHTAAGENVGVATGDPAAAVLWIHHSMMNEGPCPHTGCPGAELEKHGHYLNLLNPAYRYVGIGIVVQNGTTWLTEDFTD